jgi:hypothetical protein
MEGMTMAPKFFALFSIIVLIVSCFGCATTSSDVASSTAGSTAIGALGGAATGAAIGALAGKGKGAAIGALAGGAAGALAGFIYAQHQEKMVRDRKAAEAYSNYQPSQGETARLDMVSVTPATSTPGGQIALNSDFTVLNGSDQPIPVDLTMTIMHQGNQVGQPFKYASQKNGTYSISTPTTIPSDAPGGRYTVLTKLQTPHAKAERSCDFQISSKTASGERQIQLVSVNGVPVNSY